MLKNKMNTKSEIDLKKSVDVEEKILNIYLIMEKDEYM